MQILFFGTAWLLVTLNVVIWAAKQMNRFVQRELLLQRNRQNRYHSHCRSRYLSARCDVAEKQHPSYFPIWSSKFIQIYGNATSECLKEKLSGTFNCPEYQAWIDSGGTLPFPDGESENNFWPVPVQQFLRLYRPATLTELQSLHMAERWWQYFLPVRCITNHILTGKFRIVNHFSARFSVKSVATAMEREELTIMYLQMAGLDYHTASMEQREPFSFSKEQQETILKALKDSVQGSCCWILVIERNFIFPVMFLVNHRNGCCNLQRKHILP